MAGLEARPSHASMHGLNLEWSMTDLECGYKNAQRMHVMQ